MSFERVRTSLSQQSYPGSFRALQLTDGETVKPLDGRSYTKVKIRCPACGSEGWVKDYHGTNCFVDCRNCGQGLKL